MVVLVRMRQPRLGRREKADSLWHSGTESERFWEDIKRYEGCCEVKGREVIVRYMSVRAGDREWENILFIFEVRN